jgi:hypothetical protein
MQTRAALVAMAALVASCNGDDDDAGAAFPEDYAATYVEVRDCRQSGGDHEINHFTVLTDPASVEAYNGQSEPFGVGAVVLKEEYDFGDSDCTGPIKQWSVMVKLADGEAPPDQLGWRWQRVLAADRTVAEENVPRCFGCHSLCTPENGGYDGTCTLP